MRIIPGIRHLGVIADLNFQPMSNDGNSRAEKPQPKVQHAGCSWHLYGPGAVASSLLWKAPKVSRPTVDDLARTRPKAVHPEERVELLGVMCRDCRDVRPGRGSFPPKHSIDQDGAQQDQAKEP
jgi:DNA-nicking Smr family endonuclease